MQSAIEAKSPRTPFKAPPPSKRSDPEASGDHLRATLVGFCHPSKSGGELGEDDNRVGEEREGEEDGGSDEDTGALTLFEPIPLFTGTPTGHGWRILAVTSHGPKVSSPPHLTAWAPDHWNPASSQLPSRVLPQSSSDKGQKSLSCC